MYQDIVKKIDKIVISRQEYQKIAKWQEQQALTDLCTKRRFFPLGIFSIDADLKKDINLQCIVELENFDPRNMKVTFPNGDFFTAKRGDNNDGWQFDGQVKTIATSEFVEKCTGKNVVEGMFVIIYGILAYIVTKGRERYDRVSPNTAREEREHYEYQERECFLLNDIVKYVCIHPTRKSIQYRCECWGVRGHLRHLKNGGIIFIKPFKKGRKRDVLEPKNRTYLLGGSNDESGV